MRAIMITGGLGFIGSNLVRYWKNKYPNDRLVVIDSMTYAAREKWVLSKYPDLTHLYVDIRDQNEVRKAVRMFRPDGIIHLAAESHVCRSIDGPKDFVNTNILGTFNLLEAFRELGNGGRFHHVSTDEVYGEAANGLKFDEKWGYAPRSPYAASKAASDHLVKSWYHTYGINTVVTNCSNNFGPNQHEEKLIPKIIMSLLLLKPMTIYGDGCQIRDWLYVSDHCTAIDRVFHSGIGGESYCVGGDNELTNLGVMVAVRAAFEEVMQREAKLVVKHTNDRPTDDQRYAIDCSKLKALGWVNTPKAFMDNLKSTVAWYSKWHMGIKE